MMAIMRSMRPRSVMQTASMMVWVRLSIVDEEVEIDAAAVELNGEDVVVKLVVGLVGMTWLVLSVAVAVVVEEGWIRSEDGIEEVAASDDV
jgi:hypothetical protein